ncbi:hypothetical protein [Xenorhabdus ishibashii]|uniref:Uncharacterized protein n=1 Tax=Xenorhabdus ishibashii TaxID=1034471 RepID=A0A2D0KCG8_9GAMM|nr:hypothetical protein [Xenorhabdus ishibashii]PHM61146.1 hypothetical protein Xish_00267 [Xenorhabdus ishibashii]
MAMALITFLKITNQELLDKIIERKISKIETIQRVNLDKNSSIHSDDHSLYVFDYALSYHFASDNELVEKRKEKTFLDIEGNNRKRINIFEQILKHINNMIIN